MNFELNNALCDLEVLKERIDDVVTSLCGLMKNILHTNLITY